MGSTLLTIELPEATRERLEAAAATQGQDLQNYAVAAIIRAIERDLASDTGDETSDYEAWWRSLPESEKEADIAALRASNSRATEGHARPIAEYAAEFRRKHSTGE